MSPKHRYKKIYKAAAITEASGAAPDVRSQIVSILNQEYVTVAVAITGAGLDGVLRIEVANADEENGAPKSPTWFLYGAVGAVGSGFTVNAAGEIVVSGPVSDIIRVKPGFGWLSLRWVGGAGSATGTITAELTAR